MMAAGAIQDFGIFDPIEFTDIHCILQTESHVLHHGINDIQMGQPNDDILNAKCIKCDLT